MLLEFLDHLRGVFPPVAVIGDDRFVPENGLIEIGVIEQRDFRAPNPKMVGVEENLHAVKSCRRRKNREAKSL